MILFLFIVAAALVAAVVWMLFTAFHAEIAAWWVATKARLHIIPDCKTEWKKFSTWLTAIPVAIWGFIQAAPSAASALWNDVPSDIRDHVPHQDWLAYALIGVLIAKHVRQKRLDGQQAS